MKTCVVIVCALLGVVWCTEEAYRVKIDSVVEKYCSNVNINDMKRESMVWKPTKDRVNDLFFIKMNSTLNRFLYHKDYKKMIREGWMDMGVMLVVPLVSILLCCVFLPSSIYWVASMMCGKRKDKERFEKKVDYWKKLTNLCVILLLAMTFILMIVWGYFTIIGVYTLKPLSCTASVAFSEIINGANDTTSDFFPGLGGYNHLLKGLNTSLNSLFNQSVKYNKSMEDIASSGMNSSADNMVDSLNTYTKSFNSSKVIGCKNNNVITRLNVSVVMKANISESIGNFSKHLETISRNVFTSGSLLYALYSDESKKTNLMNSLSNFTRSTDQIHNDTVKVKNIIMANFDYDKTTKIIFTSLILFSISIFITLLLFSVFSFINMVLKSMNWLIHVSKIIMLCTVVLGCLVSLVACVFMTVSAIIYSSCDVLDRSLIFPSTIKSFNLLPEVNKLMDTCFNNHNDNNMIHIMNETNSYEGLQQLLRLISGFTNGTISEHIRNMDQSSLPISTYSDYIRRIGPPLYDTIDEYEIPDEGITKNKDVQNPYYVQKTHNYLVLSKDKCPSQVQNTEDNGNPSWEFKNQETYCIVMPTYKIQDYKDRYTSAKVPQPNIDDLNSLGRCITNYTDLTKRMQDFLSKSTSTSPISTTISLRDKLSQALSKMSEAKTILKSPLNFIESKEVNSSYSKLFDCRIVKKEMLLLRYSICHKFYHSLSKQSTVLYVLSPTIVLLSIFMCCQLRIIERDKNKLPAHMKTDTDPTVEMNELML